MTITQKLIRFFVRRVDFRVAAFDYFMNWHRLGMNSESDAIREWIIDLRPQFIALETELDESMRCLTINLDQFESLQLTYSETRTRINSGDMAALCWISRNHLEINLPKL